MKVEQVSLPIQEAVLTENKAVANKRAKSWTPEKKQAAAERMRKYWADRKKDQN